MYRNDMMRRVGQMVLEGQLGYEQIHTMSMVEMRELLDRDDLSVREMVLVKRNAYRAGRMYERLKPVRDLQTQLEGGSRTWFRRNWPNAVMSLHGDILTVNLAGMSEEDS